MEKNGILQPSGCTSSSYWFARRATYGRNIKAKSILEEKGIEVFVPMQYTIVVRNGKRKKLLMPVIKDLIFVHTTKASIQSAKADIPFLYYITRPSQGKNIPLIVPDYQMKCFCDIASSDNDDVLFLVGDDCSIEKGARVRVVEGQFVGNEGYFMRVKGMRNRRFVVVLDNIIAVSVEIPSQFVELIK